MDTFPSLTEVDRIAALPDPVLRNLQISQCYHELALAVGGRTAGQANWCHFATWASKQAGQTIRGEDLASALDQLLNAGPPSRAAALDPATTGEAVTGTAAVEAATEVAAAVQDIGAKGEEQAIRETVWDVLNPFAAVDRASAAIARGNQKVFAEIGREFARFAEACLADSAFDAVKIDAFCAGLRPGDPPDGQRYLRQAFRRIYRAFFESQPISRAQFMLLANLEIGLHEQTRLQPEIAAGLEALLIDPGEFRARLLKALFPYRGWPVRLLLWFKRLLRRPSPLDAAIERLYSVARRQLRLLLTEQFMTISLPHGLRLRLGQDLTAKFPDDLKVITDPDLSALLAEIDPTPNSPLDSGAVDWADLPDRLHFIADFFRSYQENRDLWLPPFTPGQVAAIKSGRRPEGPL